MLAEAAQITHLVFRHPMLGEAQQLELGRVGLGRACSPCGTAHHDGRRVEVGRTARALVEVPRSVPEVWQERLTGAAVLQRGVDIVDIGPERLQPVLPARAAHEDLIRARQVGVAGR
jgi:hypothetical protein